MKKLILLLLFLFPVLGLAQTNQQRIAIAIQNNSGYAKIIPFAQITVCTYNDLLQCNSPVTIYSDSALTQSIPYPFFADANGNFSYFSNAGTYIEKVCAPLNQCYNYPITLISSSSSGVCGSAGCVLLNSATDQIINQTAGSSFGATLDSGNVEFTAGGTGDFLATMAGGEAAFTVGNGFNVADISTTGIDLTTQGPVDISGNLYSAAFTTTVDESSGGDWEQAVGGNYTLNATEAFFDMAANWTGLSSGTAANCLALDSSNNVVLTACSNLTGAVQTAPTASQTISQPAGTLLQVLYDSNSSSGFKITNTSTGTSGGTLLALSNGTDEGFFGLSGTGTSFPGYFLFQLNTSGGQLKFDTNNGDIVFAPNGGNINFSNLLSAPCLSTDGSGNLLPTCSGGGTYPTSGYYGLSGGSSWITSSLSDNGTNVTSTEPLTVNATANPTQFTLTYNTGHAPAGVSGSAVLAPDTSGNLDVNENNTGFSQVCTATNGICSGSSAFSAITGGTNTTAAMQVGSGATLGPTGTGTVNANQVNGAAVPASALFAGTNSSDQIVAATTANMASFLSALTGCTTAGYAYVPADGQCEAVTPTGFIEQVPATTAANTIAPSSTGIVPLTVKCPSGCSTDIFDIYNNTTHAFWIDSSSQANLGGGLLTSPNLLTMTSSNTMTLRAYPNGKTADFDVLSGWGGTVLAAGTVVAVDTAENHGVGACAASCTNAFAVVNSNPASNNDIQTIGSVPVNLDGTYTVTPGEFVCTSATGGDVTPQSTACTTQQVGYVTTGATSVTSATVFLDFQSARSGGGTGTVTSFAAPSGLWPSWLVPTVTDSTSTPSLAVAASAIPNSALASQTANTVLGALTATTPSGLAMPSCSTSTSALEWTSGTGFGCHTIAGMTYPSGSGVPIVSGGSSWGTTVAAPSGTIVGTTDTQTLTNKTVDGVTPTVMGYVDATSSIQTQLNAKAALASPTFTGTPAAPTATSGTDTTQIATTAFVQTALTTGIPLSCQPGIGDGLNAIPAGTYLTTSCRNETGQTWTLTAIRCVADSGSSTCNVTNGAGTALLTGAITGSSTYANGTQSGTTTIASGDYLKITFVADGTTKQIAIDVAGTY